MFDSPADTLLRFGTDSASFHNIVFEAFAEVGKERRAIDRLCNEIRAGVYDIYAPSNVGCFDSIGIGAARTTLLNVVDFLFEAIVLQSMNQQQLLRYFTGIEKTMALRGPLNSSFGRGLIIETVHHNAIFSIVLVLARELMKQGGKNRLILLNQGQRQEPRLNLAAGILAKFFGVRSQVLTLQGLWYKKLTEMMLPTTTVLYLADMPSSVSTGSAQNPHLKRELRLSHMNTSRTGIIETESVAFKLSQKLSADHVTVDFPDRTTIEVNPDVNISVPLRCNIEDWVFGPAIKAR